MSDLIETIANRVAAALWLARATLGRSREPRCGDLVPWRTGAGREDDRGAG